MSLGLLLAPRPSAARSVDAPASESPAGTESGSVPKEFSTLHAAYLTIHYPKELGAEARVLAQVSGPFREELERELAADPSSAFLEKVEVRLGRTPLEMEKLAPPGNGYPKYASGVAYPSLRLILLSARPRYPGDRHNLAEIFRHELAHVGLYDRLSGDKVPRWFNEGFAVFASGEAEMSRMQTLWTATLAQKLIPFQKLERSFPMDEHTASVAYAQAADMVRFLQRGDGLHRFQSLFGRMDQGQSFSAALADAYGSDLASLEVEWRQDAARRYTFWPILLSSSTIWVLAMGLFGVAYVRRRKKARAKLARWTVEEAKEDAERQRIADELTRIRIVLAHPELLKGRVEVDPDAELLEKGLTFGVPFVEHGGSRHTLH